MKKANAATLRVLYSILLLMLFAAPVYAQDITSGLVGHWKLDEGSGTTVTDSTGGGNTGTMENGLTADANSADGKVSSSLDFDGTGDRINFGDVLDLGADYTLSAWVNPDNVSGGGHRVIDKDNVSNGWALSIGDSGNDGTLRHFNRTLSAGGIFDTPVNTVKAGIWQHVAVSRNLTDQSIKLYVNAELITTFTGVTGTAPDTATPLGIGGSIIGTSARYNGRIDDVRIYNRALSGADLKELYASTPGALRYKASTEGIEYFNAQEWVHAGLGSYQPNSVSFDGTNDDIYLNTPLNDVNDGTKVTGSFWARRDASENGNLQVILQGEVSKSLIQWEITDRFFTKYKNAEEDDVLGIRSTATYSDGNWHHVLWSADLNIPGSARMYVDDVDVTNNNFFGDANPANGTNNTLDFTLTDLRIGANIGGSSNFLNGNIADFWLEYGTYIDLTVEANRRKFISASGMPMYLGPDGSLPLGKSPDIFLSGSTSDWHINKGTGGDFTENGALTTATSFPGDNEPSMSWALQGTELNIPGGQPTLTHLDANTIAFIDSVQEDLRTYRWDGSNWAQIGNDFNIAGIGNPSLTKIDLNTVAFIDRDLDELRTYVWNGSDWSQRGSALAIANLNNDVAIEQITTNTVAYVDATNKELRTYSWNGSNWSQVGSSLNVGNIFDPKMTLIDTNTVALYGSLVPNGVRTFEWSGSAWSVVGNDLAEGFSKAELTTLSTNRIALYGEATNELRVYDWDGTDWSQVGVGLNIPQAFSAFTAMGTIDRNTISFIDAANDALRTYSFEDITPCSAPTGQPGDLIYNSDQNVMQYCNGTDWVAMGPTGITSGSGCSDPAGVTGDLIYNEDYNIMQYCNSDEWIGIALNDTTTNLAVASLVAHWTLDESSGTTVIDATGNHNGTSSDATPSWLPSEGIVDGALDIDSDETIDTGAWDVNGTGLTLAGWLYLESATQDPRIICKTSGFTDSDSDWCWIWDDATGEMEFRLTTVNGYEDQRTTNLEYFNDYGNEWHHFAITYDAASGGIVFYLDGNEFSTATHSFGGAVISGSGETVALGNNSVGGLREWDGLLDDLRVYDAPLTAAQILDIYEQSVPTTLTDNLIGHWTLDETSGTTANDISGNSFNGTMTGGLDAGTDSVSGQVSTALDFDGDDGIQIANNAALENFSAFTLVAWVYPTSSGQGSGSRVISKSDGGSADNYNLGYSNSSRSWFRIATDGGSQTEMQGNVLPQNQWTQIVGTWNGQNMRLFENGVEVAGSPLSKTGTLDADGTALTIGRHATSPAGRYFPGRIDDARVYDRALSAGEVKLLYEATQ